MPSSTRSQAIFRAACAVLAGDLQSGLRGALAVAALEHVELAVLNGELHVLHVAVVILEQGADLDELIVRLGELLLHLGDGHRSADAGHDVLALGVGQELAQLPKTIGMTLTAVPQE